MYSTITKKTCKCGCGRMPSLGYNGFRFSCAPQDILDKVGSKKEVARKNKNNRLALGRKLHQAQNENNPEKDYKETWFKNTRKKLTGFCQCGCGKPSSKNDFIGLDGRVQSHFRSSCCHIFPKSEFLSIQYHPLNYVERAFWGGCHTNMDNQSMGKWPNFADWEDIKEKFHTLAPLLTDEERASKFYTHLEKLIYAN